MKLNSIATPLAFGLSAIVVLSGGLMFFGLKTAPIHVIHEWLGMIFAAAIALHLINHKKPTVQHFKKPLTAAVIAAVIAASAAIYMSIPQNGVSAAKEIAMRASNAPIAQIAPLFGMDAQTIADRLAEKGYKIEGGDQTLRQIAAANETSMDHIVTALAAK